jgi:hypothetical protein
MTKYVLKHFFKKKKKKMKTISLLFNYYRGMLVYINIYVNEFEDKSFDNSELICIKQVKFEAKVIRNFMDVTRIFNENGFELEEVPEITGTYNVERVNGETVLKFISKENLTL